MNNTVSIVPKISVNMASKLLEKLSKKRLVTLGNPDKIVLMNDNLSVSLKDFLRALFTRQAKVSNVETFLSKILTHLNVQYIRNRQVSHYTRI